MRVDTTTIWFMQNSIEDFTDDSKVLTFTQ